MATVYTKKRKKEKGNNGYMSCWPLVELAQYVILLDPRLKKLGNFIIQVTLNVNNI